MKDDTSERLAVAVDQNVRRDIEAVRLSDRPYPRWRVKYVAARVCDELMPQGIDLRVDPHYLPPCLSGYKIAVQHPTLDWSQLSFQAPTYQFVEPRLGQAD